MSNIKFPMKPAIHRVERIQPQSPGVWMIPTLSQNTTSLFKILEDTDDMDRRLKLKPSSSCCRINNIWLV